MKDKLFNRLGKKAKRAPEYPSATLALYGPDDDDRHATKAVIGIRVEDDDIAAMRTWELAAGNFSPEIVAEMDAFMEKYGVKTIIAPDGVIGCPHGDVEMDDAGGKLCPDPACAFWVNKDGKDRFKKRVLILERSIRKTP
jgi:hypothetical protein